MIILNIFRLSYKIIKPGFFQLTLYGIAESSSTFSTSVSARRASRAALSTVMEIWGMNLYLYELLTL
ncbi:hypothetical protein MBAV_001059 [Candidatus Magnetobacterium bavaricum]|uniref:Uncharacterized protein n=1 Tax=Candidatus Magnetobacterium bavaricum TaxID=29290 RepID=A0A0F3GXU8_9BACT|nr:hypothetical protein MBAV_001059 [Candidatus Magnetobacterium bavaricum]